MNLKIQITDFETHSNEIESVRTRVFVEEQAIPAELEFDQYDRICIHVVIFESEDPIATGRLNLMEGGRIGRIAVLQSHRRMGLGTKIMNALENEARKHKANGLWFHAQEHAVPFYQTLGYETYGELFQEDGIPHIAMKKIL